MLTLLTHLGELDSVALLVSPDHSTDRVNGYTRETGNRNDNWTVSFGFKSLTSTCIPPWLRFQLTPRIVRDPLCKSPAPASELACICGDSITSGIHRPKRIVVSACLFY